VKKVSARRLRELLIYDALAGTFTWRVPVGRKTKAGKPAGKIHHTRYRNIRIDGRDYMAHRLAWLYVRGCWPSGPVRARNKDLLDLRWANLQMRTRKQLAQSQNRAHKNSGTGVLGVGINGLKPYARISANGQRFYLGTHDTVEAAGAVYQEAKKRLHKA
jgi:hypothetical protein